MTAAQSHIHQLGEESSVWFTLTPLLKGPSNPLTVLPTVPIPLPRPLPVRCKKGFHKVTKSGHVRCVKIKVHRHPRKHQQKKATADEHRVSARVP